MDSLFLQMCLLDKMIDFIGVSKGHGFKVRKSDGCHVKHDRPNRIRQVSFLFCFCFGLSGVNKSWHTKKLARKTHKRLEEGGLHWSLASFSCGIHGRSCRADRRSSPHGDQQGLLSSKKKDTKIYLKISFTIQDRKLNDC